DKPDDFARTGFLPPNMTLLVRCDYFRPFLHWPLATDRTRSVAYFMFPKERCEQPGFQRAVEVYVDWTKKVLEEDRKMVESLQRAMVTRGYEPGPFSYQETSVHHMISGHLDRLFGPVGSA